MRSYPGKLIVASTLCLLLTCVGNLHGQQGNDSIVVVTAAEENIMFREINLGYGFSQIRKLSGSVSIIDNSVLNLIHEGNVSNQLQGLAAGVNVTGSGVPGEMSKVRIRGFSSFINNDPLYVIDGVPTQDISSLNTNDICYITILKDAGTTSIYGSRASNGVVIITTRKGSNELKVSYNMSFGTQLPGKGTSEDVLNTQEYANLQWLVYKNDGTSETHPVYGPSSNATPQLPYWAANTDWYKAITRSANIMNHDLSISGGGEKTKFTVAFGYFNQDGIIKYTSSSRYSLRFNSEFTLMKDRIRVGENLGISYRSKLGVPNLTDGNPVQSGPYRSQSIIPVIITQSVTGPSHNFVPGEWGGAGMSNRLGNAPNELALLTRDKDDKFWDIRMIGNIYLDVKIIEGLNFRSSFGGTWDNGYNVNYTYATYENSENASIPMLGESSYYNGDWIWTNTLSFDRTFGKHNIRATAGYEAMQYGAGREMDAERAGYFSDEVSYRTLTNGASIVGAYSTLYTPTKQASLFVSGDYSFLNKYILSVSARRDGCSRFGEYNRFGIFPSVSGAWLIGDEHFLDNIKWLSFMKFRVSYGLTGNQLAISPQNIFFQYGGNPASSYYDLNGTGNSSVIGFYPLAIGNPRTKWESTSMLNTGLDARLFNDKVGLTFDWYSKESDDILFHESLPGTSGPGNLPYINVGSMKTTGIDVRFSYDNKWGDFGFNGSVVFTTYKNKIVKITDAVDYFSSGSSRIGSVTRNAVGHSLSEFFGYQVTGLFQDQNEVTNAPHQDGAEQGFFRYANIDTTSIIYLGNRTQYINPNDRTFIGDPNPDFTYGINIGVSWKNFDLSCFLYGTQGNDILNYNRWFTDFWPSFQGQKSKALLYNSWTTGKEGATTPKASNKSNFSTNTQICSYYIEDGSYLRLKSLQLGYTIPANVVSKVNIKSLRLYIQCVNLFTLTKYSGLDPEIGGGDLSFGIDSGNYPKVKQFIFGLNLTL